MKSRSARALQAIVVGASLLLGIAAVAAATPLIDTLQRALVPETSTVAAPPPPAGARPSDPGAATGAGTATVARPGLSPEAQAYFAAMQPKFKRIAEALGRLGEQSARLRRNPSLLQDADWQRQTAPVVADLANTASELQSYEPVPAELENLNGLMVEIGLDLAYIADEYAAAMDRQDSARIANATGRVISFPTKAQRAMAEFQRLAGI